MVEYEFDPLRDVMKEHGVKKKDISRLDSNVKVLIDHLAEDRSTDFLTEISNRRSFDREMKEAISAMDRELYDVGEVIIDIADFDDINNTYGHLMGDDALRGVAKKIVKSIRRSDTPARTGGDEFGIVLRGKGNRGLYHIIFTLPLKTEEIYINVGDKKNPTYLNVDLDIGATALDRSWLGKQMEQCKANDKIGYVSSLIYDKVDQAMYRAKNHSKARGKGNVVCLWIPERNDENLIKNLKISSGRYVPHIIGQDREFSLYRLKAVKK
ncbi:MAG: GGDEF domain-containing protein [Candidatus Aenigmarchaeota archaeon]|nr:GGDEF domain-containing protein [Candidatus Aenigmarchaeota archaeon]